MIYFSVILLASTLSSDAKQLDFSQDRDCKAVSDDLQHGKNGGDKSLDRPGECATNLASNENGIEVAPRNDVSSGETLRDGNKGAQVPLVSEKLSKTCDAVESLPEVNVPWNLPVKEEVCNPLPCVIPSDEHLCFVIHLTCDAMLLLCLFSTHQCCLLSALPVEITELGSLW